MIFSPSNSLKTTAVIKTTITLWLYPIWKIHRISRKLRKYVISERLRIRYNTLLSELASPQNITRTSLQYIWRTPLTLSVRTSESLSVSGRRRTIIMARRFLLSELNNNMARFSPYIIGLRFFLFQITRVSIYTKLAILFP